ncbi:MAG: hypothetical protein ACI9OJ_003915 [Myxococcota bacterium]|jgi:hypothetical protein
MNQRQKEAIERNRNAWMLDRARSRNKRSNGTAAPAPKRTQPTAGQRMRRTIDSHAAYMRETCPQFLSLDEGYARGGPAGSMRSFLARQAPPKYGDWGSRTVLSQVGIYRSDCMFYASPGSGGNGKSGKARKPRLPPIVGTCEPMNLDACKGRCDRGYGPGCKVWRRYMNERSRLSKSDYEKLVNRQIAEGRVFLMKPVKYTRAQKSEQQFFRAFNHCHADKVAKYCQRLSVLLGKKGKKADARAAAELACYFAKKNEPKAVHGACTMAQTLGSKIAFVSGRSGRRTQDVISADKKVAVPADEVFDLQRKCARVTSATCWNFIHYFQRTGDHRQIAETVSKLCSKRKQRTKRIRRTCEDAVAMGVADQLTATEPKWGSPASLHMEVCRQGEVAACYRARRLRGAWAVRPSYRCRPVRLRARDCRGARERRACGIYGQLVSRNTYRNKRGVAPVPCYGIKACAALKKSRERAWKREVAGDSRLRKDPRSRYAFQRRAIKRYRIRLADLQACATAELPKRKRPRKKACKRYLTAVDASLNSARSK